VEDRATLAVCALAGLGVALLFARIARWFSHLGRVRRARRAMRAEERAAGLLDSLGYHVLGRQVGASYVLEVDGEPARVDLRADYVVSRNARRYVAEVKTGRFAPRIDNRATRRQLLEYRLAFDVDGVLLVDEEAGRVLAVEFPLEGREGRPRALRALLWLCVGCAAGLAAAAVGDPWRAFFR
jgi:hypothetical protein